MKKYAVAILSCFDNENKIYFISADSASDAVKLALIESCSTEEYKAEQVEYNKMMPDDLEELKSMLYNQELCVNAKEIPTP